MPNINEDLTLPPSMGQPQFNDCILIGFHASFEHVKADGDILFSTPENKLLISGGIVYLNGTKLEECDGNTVSNTIKEAFALWKSLASIGAN